MPDPGVTGGELRSLGDGRFEIHGDLTFESASGILEQSKLQFADFRNLHIDLTGIEDADSAGLALLIEWLSWAQQSEREIDFVGLPTQLAAIAEISEVSELVAAAPESRQA